MGSNEEIKKELEDVFGIETKVFIPISAPLIEVPTEQVEIDPMGNLRDLKAHNGIAIHQANGAYTLHKANGAYGTHTIMPTSERPDQPILQAEETLPLGKPVVMEIDPAFETFEIDVPEVHPVPIEEVEVLETPIQEKLKIPAVVIGALLLAGLILLASFARR